jgi:hypothetical protein
VRIVCLGRNVNAVSVCLAVQAARHVLPTEAKQLLDSMLSGDSSKSYSHDGAG